MRHIYKGVLKTSISQEKVLRNMSKSIASSSLIFLECLKVKGERELGAKTLHWFRKTKLPATRLRHHFPGLGEKTE